MIILSRKALGLEVENKVGFAGLFKCVVRRADGSIKQETPWFDNLILDAGLNRWGAGAIINRAMIGTGTSAPNVTQIGLDATAGNTTTQQGAVVNTPLGVSPYYMTTTMAYRFNIGALNGNFTEVGVGWDVNLCFSRALIVDGGGTPTAITVLSTEQLDVYYQLRKYPPLADISVGKTIGGVATTVTGRASLVNATSGSISHWGTSPGSIVGVHNMSNWNNNWDGPIGVITGQPSGSGNGTGSSTTLGSYSNNSYSRAGRATYALNDANLAGGIDSTSITFSGLQACFQYGFSPPIAKTASHTLTLDYSVTWARRP